MRHLVPNLTTPTRRARPATLLLVTALASGCGQDMLKNLTADLDGNVSVIVVNDTDFRAALTLGSYDALDRDPPGPASIQQFRVEARTSTAPVEVTCARNCAVGTQELFDRIVDRELDKSTADFDDDAFDTVVHFSDAPATSPLAAAPLIGSADGVNKRLAVDYSCGDQLIFTLRQDPDAPGGFRIDFSVIQN